MKLSLGRCLSILMLLALPALAAAPVQRDAALRRVAVPAEDQRNARVIVKYRAEGGLMRESIASAGRDALPQHAQRLSQRLGVALRNGQAITPHSQVLFARGMAAGELLARLAKDPDVEWAEVDHRMRIAVAPNDPRYAGAQTSITPIVGQWYLRAPDTSIVSAINAEAAWDVTNGSPAIVVAVLDTGVRPDHPDLAGKLLPGYDFVSEDGPGDFATANDGDGRDADPSDPGDWITLAEDTAPGGVFENCGETDSSWHGTQTGGLIGAATNNGVGMASVGRNVRILPVRVLGKCGGFQSDVVAGMRWAAGVSSVPVANPNRAHIINLSLGSTGACSAAYQSAVNDVVAAGVAVVVSAGNDAGLAVGRPANCVGAIGVGGLRNVGTKVGFSNVGPELAISAPGGNCINTQQGSACLFPILTTTNAGTTVPGAHTFSDSFNISVGTSFSAPLVAGTAALMLSVNPSMTPAQLRSNMMASARPFPGKCTAPATPMCRAPDATDQLECHCTAATCGAGMLDAGAAVWRAAGGAAAVVQASASPTAPLPNTSVALSSQVSGLPAGRMIASYQWSIVDGDCSSASFTGSTSSASATVQALTAGTFTARLTVTDSASATSSADVIVVVGAAPPTTSGGGGGALQFGWLLALLAAVIALSRRR